MVLIFQDYLQVDVGVIIQYWQCDSSLVAVNNRNYLYPIISDPIEKFDGFNKRIIIKIDLKCSGNSGR